MNVSETSLLIDNSLLTLNQSRLQKNRELTIDDGPSWTEKSIC